MDNVDVYNRETGKWLAKCLFPDGMEITDEWDPLSGRSTCKVAGKFGPPGPHSKIRYATCVGKSSVHHSERGVANSRYDNSMAGGGRPFSLHALEFLNSCILTMAFRLVQKCPTLCFAASQVHRTCG